MTVYAIDPGTEQSALVVYDSTLKIPINSFTQPNEDVLRFLRSEDQANWHNAVLVIEQIESMGMPVGREVFTTVWWSGRFFQVWRGTALMIPRRSVKLAICHSTRATDANIRQELYDRFGGKLKAVGRKATPGPLYRLKGHEYAALALAITHAHGER